MAKAKKFLKVLGIVLVGLVLLLLFLLSSLVKSYVEKNDQELLGREVLIESIGINYLSMAISIEGFDLKEADGIKSFLKFDRMYLNLEPWKLFSNTIYIEEYKLDGLNVSVEQNGKSFNFDDLLALGESTDTTTAEQEDSSEPWYFGLANFHLSNGKIRYESDINPLVELEGIDVAVPLFIDTAQYVNAFVNLNFATGGVLSLSTKADMWNTFFNLHIEMQELNLKMIEPYFTAYMDLNSVEGTANADLRVSGNWENTDIMNVGGSLGIRKFEIQDPRKERLMALGDLAISIDTIQMSNALYNIDYVRVKELYGIYEMYDDGSDNITRLLKNDTQETTQANDTTTSTDTEAIAEAEIDYSNPFAVLGYYIKDIAKSYTESEYKVGEVSISETAFDYVDYTPRDPFRYHLTDFKFLADSLNSDNEVLKMDFRATLNGTGRFEGYLKSYTANLADLDLYYEIEGVELTPFSPYTSHYVNYPVVLGDMLYISDTKIRDGKIVSSNNINFNQFNFGKKNPGSALYDLPVKLAINLLKDLNGDIHLDVPIEGDLNDPEYKLGKIIWQTVKNILLKAVTAPFKILARTFGMDEDELKSIDFGLMQNSINEHQQGQLKDLSKILEDKKEVNVEFKRVTKKYEEVERYCILKAVSLYLKQDENLTIETISDEDRQALLDFDIKDENFSLYVNSKIPERDWTQPIQKRCIIYIGEEKAIAATDRVGNLRSESIRAYLVNERGLDNERLRFVVLPEDSLITHRSNAIYNVGFWIAE